MGQSKVPDSVVLVVYDDEDLCRMLSKILQDSDYHVTSVHTRRDALRELKRRNVRLVLLDSQTADTGELGTLELIKKMKSLRPEMSIIYMASPGTAEMMGKVKCLEAVELLDMPFRLENLLELVQEKVTPGM